MRDRHLNIHIIVDVSANVHVSVTVRLNLKVSVRVRVRQSLNHPEDYSKESKDTKYQIV